MHKLFLTLFFLAITHSNIAQESDSYIDFTATQKTTAQKKSEEKLGFKISFNKGVLYEDKLFWFVSSKDEKTFYFNSSKNFEDIKYIEEYYDYLMEYIMEEADY